MKQSQPSKLTVLACLLGFGALATVARAGTVTYDFTTDPKTGASPIEVFQAGFADDSGESQYYRATGGNPGGFLALTWPIAGSSSIVKFPDIDAGKIVTSFTLEADLRIGNPQQTDRPADGFSINFARSTDPAFEATDAGAIAGAFATSGAVETGTQTGIAISFDTWAGNALPDGGDIEGIIVRVDNVTVLRQAMPTRNGTCADTTSLQTGPRDTAYWDDPDTGAKALGTLPGAAFLEKTWTNLCWQKLIVELDPTAKLTVTYKGLKVLDQYQTTFFPSAGGIILAGRTGGADEHTHFDNLKLTTVSATDATPPSAPGAPKVDSTSAEKVTISWAAATDDSGRVGYNIDRDGVVIRSLLPATAYTDFAVEGGKTYVYKIQAVDIAGNQSAFTTTVSATTPASNPVDTAGLFFEAWNNIAGTPISGLTDDPRYIANAPDKRALATAADTRTVYQDDSHENYGGRLSGTLTPTEAGNYEFFLRSDDASVLNFSPDENPAGLALIAEEVGCCAAFQESGDPRTSAPISLVAGKKYAFQVLWKEGGGGDYAQVAWRKAGDTTPAVGLAPIPGKFFTTKWDTNLGQPVLSKSLQFTGAGTAATLKGTVIAGSKPITYEWKPFFGTNIVNETNDTLVLGNVNLTNIGRVYTLTAKNEIGQSTANFAVIPKGTLFVEAEDFNFANGDYVKNLPIGMTGPYNGGLYFGKGDVVEKGVDYNSDGTGVQLWRELTDVDVAKQNQHPDGLPRGEFDVTVNAVVGWNDAGEWENYTRVFPAAADYNVIGRLASGGAAIHMQMDEVTAGAKTASQTLAKLGEFNPGRATAGWDNMEFFPLVDTNGAPSVIKGWTGEKTFKVTFLPGSAGDMDYFMFIPASGGTVNPGNSITGVAKNGNNLVITYTGTLEQADAVTGPWTAVANATSPATIPITGQTKFLRVK